MSALGLIQHIAYTQQNDTVFSNLLFSDGVVKEKAFYSNLFHFSFTF